MTRTKKKLTAAQKRVLIAKDTLKWLATRRIKPKGGVYFRLPDRSVSVVNLDDKLDQTLVKVTKSCTTCALGGMFYSMVRRFDKVPVSVCDINPTNGGYLRGVRESGVYAELRKYFSVDQLYLIESAFEETDMVNDGSSDAAAAISFAARASAPARLRAIMNNIIENKGEFRP